MPKVRRLNRKPPPEGFDQIESTLLEIHDKMRAAEIKSHEGMKRAESTWPIFRLHHQRSKYVYDLYHKRKAISKELFDYCVAEGYADAALIAKWKKPGFEKLCCLRCVQSKDTDFGTACICRVPGHKLEDGRMIECLSCGCRGCASGG